MLRLVAVSALILSVVGCVSETLYMDPQARIQGGITKGQSGEGFSRGALQGDLGPIRNFNDRQAAVQGDAGDEFGGANVTVTGATNEGTGFMIIDLYGMNLRDMPAGVHQVSADDYSDIYVTICSDSNDASVHFDGPADEATVTVADVENGQRLVTIDSSIGGDEYSGFDERTDQSASFVIDR